MIQEIDRACRQLHEARELPSVLTAGQIGFDVLAAGCQAGDQGEHELFAAFMFAWVAAAGGRIALADAGSLPSGISTVAHGLTTDVPESLGELADALAQLAQILHQRLAQAGRTAGLEDARACEDAAIHAATAYRLLVKGS